MKTFFINYTLRVSAQHLNNRSVIYVTISIYIHPVSSVPGTAKLTDNTDKPDSAIWPADLKVARAALHMWEEPCISGKAGSGAVFFLRMQCGLCLLSESCHCCRPERQEDFYRETGRHFSGTANKRCQQYQPCHTGALCPIHCTGPCYGQGKGTASANHLQLQRLFFSDCSAYSFLIMSTFWLPDFKYYSPELSRKYSHAHGLFYSGLSGASIHV